MLCWVAALVACPASKPKSVDLPNPSLSTLIKPSPAIDGRPESQQTPPFVLPAALLRRPIALPRLASGQPCPITTKRTITVDGQPYEGALGRGPAYFYPFELPRDRNGVYHLSGAREVRSWFIPVGMWWVHPGERDPILIRARRLDGGGQMLLGGWGPAQGPVTMLDDGQEVAPFATGTVLTQHDVPNVTSSGWTNYPPAYFAMRSPGCYGLQVDGVSFSYPVVMKIAP